MKITFEIQTESARIVGGVGAPPSSTNKKILWLLESLIKCNQIWLDSHPDTPSIYDAGVVYRPERGKENWLDVPHILQLGYGDCEDLGAWRVAELRNSGIPAKAFLKWQSNGVVTVYHVMVMRNGKLEDPSKRLGMKGQY